MQAFVGVSGSLERNDTQTFLKRDYFRAMLSTGLIPVVLSPDMDEASTRQCLSRMDGLLLAGGVDVEPSLYGETASYPMEIAAARDQFELVLIRLAMQARMPIFGICRGIQVLNVALGGTLYQDLPLQRGLYHQAAEGVAPMAHAVQLEKAPFLTFAPSKAKVNSFHHQAIKDIAPTLACFARAEDDLAEGVYSPDYPYLVAVQWHPERDYRSSELSQALLSSFAKACEQFSTLQKRLDNHGILHVYY